MTGGDTLVYTWDDQNRLVAVAKEGEDPFVTYEYDDDNIRVSQTVGDETTEFVVDKNRAYAQVLAEYIGSQLIEEYVYGLDLIEQTDGITGDEAFFGVDGLGSTVVLTDENGEVIETYEYDEFGELEDAAGELATDYLFAGEQFDAALGDYYLRQRYYDPTVGRFTRRDTYEGRLNEPITLNKFVYANSDPVNGIDPSGLMTLTEINATSKIQNELKTKQSKQIVHKVVKAKVYDLYSGHTISKFGVIPIPHGIIYSVKKSQPAFADTIFSPRAIEPGWRMLIPSQYVPGEIMIRRNMPLSAMPPHLKIKVASFTIPQYLMWSVTMSQVAPGNGCYNLFHASCLTWTAVASALAKAIEKTGK